MTQPLLTADLPAPAATEARTIYPATARDVAFVVHLQKLHSGALGFLPRQTHERYIAMSRVLMVQENGCPAGYLNWLCTPAGLVRIPQVAVHPDLLRSHIGTQLIAALRAAALAGNCTTIRLTSRSDLACNAVWPTLGFTPTGYTTPANARKRPLIEWSLRLYSPAELQAALEHHNGNVTYQPPAEQPMPKLHAIA
jgi:N-acetylglutamate synthase-like GNAT family acetyltransferase